MLIFSLGCRSSPSDADRATAVVNRMMAARQANELDRACDFYAPMFYRKTRREDWKATLVMFPRRLGPLQTWTVVDAKVSKEAGDAGLGPVVALQVKSTYARFEATEALILCRPSGAADFLILGHTIASPGLQPEEDP